MRVINLKEMSKDNKQNLFMFCMVAVGIAGMVFIFLNGVIALLNYVYYLLVNYIGFVIAGLVVLLIIRKMLKKEKKV